MRRFDDVRSQLHLKGISTIPIFTLGKPAVIFDLSMGKRNLRFEPQFRFALAGKPWSFIFWWRYKLLRTDRFLINADAHPALTFKSVFMRFIPQFYHLKLDKQDGFYFTAALALAKRNFPLSISAIINKTIQTNISASKDLVRRLKYGFVRC